MPGAALAVGLGGYAILEVLINNQNTYIDH